MNKRERERERVGWKREVERDDLKVKEGKRDNICREKKARYGLKGGDIGIERDHWERKE